MICKGFGGSIELSEHSVVIRRTYVIGLLFQKGLKGDKRILFSSISAVQFKRPGVMNGYIQFTIAGGVENTAGISASASDENSLQFVNAEEFDKARDFIEKRLAARDRPNPSAPGGQTLTTVEQLEKLASLVDRGLLTKDEFDLQKQAILATTQPRVEITAEPPVEQKNEDAARMQLAMSNAIAARSVDVPPPRPPSPAAANSFGKRQSIH